MEPPADSASVSRTKIFIDYECPGAKETSRIVIALAPLTAPLFVRHAFKTPSGHCLLKLDMLTIGPSKCLISAMPHLALHKDEAYHSFTHLGRGGLNAGSFFYVPEKSFFTKSAFHIAIATVEEANSDAILLGNVVQGLEKFSEQMKQNVDQAERVRITAYGKL